MPKLPTGLVRKSGRPGYYARDQKGGRDRLVKLSNDRATALRRFKAMRSQLEVSTVTVKEAALAWLRGAVATRRSGAFRATTKQRVEDYLEPLYGYRRLAALTSEHCREYRLRLEQHGLAPQTVAHILSDLRCLLLWAVETGLLVRSPFPRRLMPKIQEGVPRRLSAEEVVACETLPGADGFECRVLLGSGIRWGEASRALASQMDRGALVVEHTKSFKVRRVPLAPALEHEIAGRVGKLFRFRNAQTLAKRVRTVVPDFSVHRTRHTYAMQYLERGGTLHALSSLLGHSSLKVTAVYLRGLPELAEREAREVMAR